MKQTIAEKILSEHSKKRVFAGDVCIADLDLIMAQDGTAPLAVKAFEKMGRKEFPILKTSFLLLTIIVPAQILVSVNCIN